MGLKFAIREPIALLGCFVCFTCSAFSSNFSIPVPVNNSLVDTGMDFAPSFATDGTGLWITVWYSFDSLDGTIGEDGDILVSRSTDNGATWTAPNPLNSNAVFDIGNDIAPEIIALGPGEWLVAWHSTDDLSIGLGSDEDILFSLSKDSGVTWSDPKPLNSNAYDDLGADVRITLARDAACVILAVWMSNESGGSMNHLDWDILFSRSHDNGLTWSPVALLNGNASEDSGDDLYPDLDFNGQDQWIAVWSSNDSLDDSIGDDYDILYSISNDSGVSWSLPSALNSNASFDTGNDQESQVGLIKDGPKIATDQKGNWVCVWNSDDDLGGTIGTDEDILVARSDDNGMTWTGPAPLTQRMISDRTDGRAGDWVPYIQTDGSGLWIVVWDSNDDLDGQLAPPINVDIFVSFSTDNGATWTDSAPLQSNAAIDSGLDTRPVLVTDHNGNWLCAWTSNEPAFGGGGGVLGEFDILSARAFLRNGLSSRKWKLYE